MKLAQRTFDIPGSETLAVTAKAAALRAKGLDVIGFGAGEPDFATPAHIVAAAKRALDDGWTRYTPSQGSPKLISAICDHMAKHFALECAPNEVMTSVGGKHALYNAVMCLANPGDEVLLPAPYWVTYPVQCTMAGARAVVVPAGADTGFRVTVEALEKATTAATRGLILNSPSNPTGAGYREEDLLAIADFVKRRDLWVLSDEMYARLVYDGYTSRFFATLPGMRERTVTVYGLSKTYAMTGWRVGITVAPAELTEAMNRVQGQVTSNIAAVCQAAAIAALAEPDDFLAGWVAEFDQRRRFMVSRLNAIEGVSCNLPEGAFYAFPDFGELLGRRYGDKVMATDWDLIDYFLAEAQVALVPGTPFGAPGFARLSYATSMANIEKGLSRMETAISRLS